MSKFPVDYDDDSTLPMVNDNITEVGGEAINSIRDAIFNIESDIGLSAAGSCGSISSRLGISLQEDGNIKPSAITSLGLVTLPIYDNQIASNAQIAESKLNLDHKTQDLFNYTRNLSGEINTALGWIGASGVKLEPHISGAFYKHTLQQINVSLDPNNYLKNKFGNYRNYPNSLLMNEAYATINDINSDLIDHQKTDSYPFTGFLPYVTTNGGYIYPANYGHTARGIFIDTNRLSIIPQDNNDLQKLVEYIDASGDFINGGIIQNLYTNGVSRESRSSALMLDGYGNTIDGYGQSVVPITPVIAYLLNTGNAGSPFDNIDTGDDIIEFKPLSNPGNIFDSQFGAVKAGDILKINYGVAGLLTSEANFIIREKKYILGTNGSPNGKYLVRVNGKNLVYSTTASARIDRSLVNNKKQGVLAVAGSNPAGFEVPSLIIGAPRAAQVLGIGFNPDMLDSSHYNLFLQLYPTGNPINGVISLPAIDVTGDLGVRSGKYTLDYVVETVNNAFRRPGFNYRFIAYSYQGEFGIMLADSYNNASFSIINGDTNSNVIGLTGGTKTAPDALGFGPLGANISGPAYSASYGSPQAAQVPTKIFVPLKRNNYYVNGREIEKLSIETSDTSKQLVDYYGDGYWLATVQNVNSFPGIRNQITYRITGRILNNANLNIGKTLTVQQIDAGSSVNFGRFVIENISFGCSGNEYTDITVYDATHGVTPITSSGILGIGSRVGLYFNYSSISFNNENAEDRQIYAPAFKRYIEVFITKEGKTFTQERARINNTGTTFSVNGAPLYTYIELSKLNIVNVSPKLRGYASSDISKVALYIENYDSSGNYSGYLCRYNGAVRDRMGALVYGKIGEVTRFYDDTGIDFIDIRFSLETSVSAFSGQYLDFQLFPTLSLDNEVMLIGSCQVDDIAGLVSGLNDKRQFGNVSEKDLSTSALDFIALPERLLHSNGVVRGFDFETSTGTFTNPNNEQIYLKGGVAVVNGKIVYKNNETVSLPLVQEYWSSSSYNINWGVCVNYKGEYQLVGLLDYDVNVSSINSPNRMMYVVNSVNSAIKYYVESSTFSNLINNRKDLCLLYVVKLVVSGSTATLTITDARRYVNDLDSNLPLKYTTNIAQGNFKSANAIFNWLKFNSSFNSTAFLGGFHASETISSSIILAADKKLLIDGQNDCELIFSEDVSVGSNVIIKDATITFGKNLNLLSTANNITFENCSLTFTGAYGIVGQGTSQSNIQFNNCIINFGTSGLITFSNSCNGIKFNNCHLINGGLVVGSGVKNIEIINSLWESCINMGFGNYLSNFIVKNSDITINYSGNQNVPIFNFTNGSDIILENNKLTINYATNTQTVDGTSVFVLNQTSNFRFINNNIRNVSYYISNNAIKPGVIFSSTYSDNVIIKDGYVNGNFLGLINFDNSNNLIIDNISIVSSFDPTTYITGGWFDSTDLVNSGKGFIYGQANTAVALENIKINNVKFYYSPIIASSNRFSFINLELNTNIAAQISNLQITNCDFNNTNISIDDKMAAISIINTISGITPTNYKPSIINTIIKNNNCNTNQSIIITSIMDSGSMNNPGLFAQNCEISNNICGNIGYWTSSGQTKTVNYNNKLSGLIIRDNICHYIFSSNNKGNYFNSVSDSGTINSVYLSGNIIIENNKVNWIHTGIIGSLTQSDSYLYIKNNYLTPYDSTYFTLPTNHAIFINGVKNYNENCIIDNNIMDNSIYNVSFSYLNGFIKCLTSCTINNNIFKSSIASNNYLIYLGGTNYIISNNKIYRNGVDVLSYIYCNNSWSSSSNGLIVDNYFDSNLNGFNNRIIIVPYNWVVKSNINHTKYTTVDYGISPGGRLSTSSSDSINDGSSSTLYYTLYANNKISIFKNGTWRQYNFSNNVLSINSAQFTSPGVYDIFIGVVDDDLVLSKTAWSGNTRLISLIYQDGILINSVDNSSLYVGTIYFDSMFNDLPIYRWIWNYYNKMNRSLALTITDPFVSTSTSTWDVAVMSIMSLVNGQLNEFVSINAIAPVYCTAKDGALHLSADDFAKCTASVGIGINNLHINSSDVYSGVSETLTANSPIVSVSAFSSYSEGYACISQATYDNKLSLGLSSIYLLTATDIEKSADTIIVTINFNKIPTRTISFSKSGLFGYYMA